MSGPEDNPADDVAADEEGWTRYRARELALAAARAARNRGDETKPDHAYLAGAWRENWEPHPWVIEAVMAGLREGAGR